MNIKSKLLLCIVLIAILNRNINGIEQDVKSKAAIVMEKSTGRVLFEKNSREKLKIASLTKIMTAILVVENTSLDDMVHIGKGPAYIGGSTVGLKYNSDVKLQALLYGMLLESGNDCAVALAEHISGNVENFAKMMNEKAYSIGAKDSNFTNPHGLDTDENYSTAYDVALITRYAMENEYINKIININNITLDFGGVNKFLSNTNRLLRTYPYCIGGKTGFTNGANRCLIAIAKKNEMTIISVILGSPTTDVRFGEGKRLLEYGLNNYILQDISDYMNWYINIEVYKGNIVNYQKSIKANIVVPLKQGEMEQIYVKQNLVPLIIAPAREGEYLGNIEMYIENEKIYDEKIILDKDIPKNSMFDYIKRGINNMFSIKLDLY